MPINPTLIAGIACIAATLGYMVGGSASPVVSVAAPAIFGLVVTAFGLTQANLPSKELLELIRSHDGKTELPPEVTGFRIRTALAPRHTGIALIVFSLAYLGGATLGAKARIENWLDSTPPAPAFPWDGKTPPANIGTALRWIAMQQKLHELGYEDARIGELYDIQLRSPESVPALECGEKTAVNKALVTPVAPTAPSGSGHPSDKEAEAVFKQWLEDMKSQREGHPFAVTPNDGKFKGAS